MPDPTPKGSTTGGGSSSSSWKTTVAYENGCEQGAKEERAAIVAWLREMSDAWLDTNREAADAIDSLALMIAEGTHRA